MVEGGDIVKKVIKNYVEKQRKTSTSLPLEACLRVAASAKAGGREKGGGERLRRHNKAI
jgi:hypothetical protein